MQLSNRVVEVIEAVFSGKRELMTFNYGWKLLEGAKAENNAEDQHILSILGNAMCLHLEEGSLDAPFSSALTHFTQSDVEQLRSTYNELRPTALKARIADIVWVLKKDYHYAEFAIDYYLELADEFFDEVDWIQCYKYIKRAYIITSSLGKRNSCYDDKCYDYICNCIIRLNGTDPLFLSIKLIDLIASDKRMNTNEFVPIISKVVNNAQSKNNHNRMIASCNTKLKLLNKLKDTAGIKETQIKLAKYFEDMAQNCDPFRARAFLEKAIHIYRQLGLRHDEEKIRNCLEPLKAKIIGNMHKITTKVDITQLVKRTEALFSICTLEEKITAFAFNAKFFKRQELKRKVIDNKKNPLKSLCTTNILDEDGNLIITIPPITASNPEVVNMHMHKMAYELECMYGGTSSHYLDAIRRDHQLTENDLDFIVKSNILLPDDRKEIVRRGFYYGFLGHYYDALQLLIPQAESFFRELTKVCGGFISVFGDDGTEQAKTLSSLFDTKELLNKYDNDILFLFRGLLCEKAGANLRNRTAHGLIKNNNRYDDISIYFIGAFMKLCAFYSPYALKVYIGMSEKHSKLSV